MFKKKQNEKKKNYVLYKVAPLWHTAQMFRVDKKGNKAFNKMGVNKTMLKKNRKSYKNTVLPPQRIGLALRRPLRPVRLDLALGENEIHTQEREFSPKA